MKSMYSAAVLITLPLWATAGINNAHPDSTKTARIANRVGIAFGPRNNISRQQAGLNSEAATHIHNSGMFTFYHETGLNRYVSFVTGIGALKGDVTTVGMNPVRGIYRFSFTTMTIPLHLKATVGILNNRLLLRPRAGVAMFTTWDVANYNRIAPHSRAHYIRMPRQLKINYELGGDIAVPSKNNWYQYGIGFGYTGSFNNRELVSMTINHYNQQGDLIQNARSESRLEGYFLHFSFSSRLDSPLLSLRKRNRQE